jgi:hypothetical protein
MIRQLESILIAFSVVDFSSHHVAFHRDAAQTAFTLGHSNPALLYRSYRELVTFEEAENFWNIVPDSMLREQESGEGGGRNDEQHWHSNQRRGWALASAQGGNCLLLGSI